MFVAIGDLHRHRDPKADASLYEHLTVDLEEKPATLLIGGLCCGEDAAVREVEGLVRSLADHREVFPVYSGKYGWCDICGICRIHLDDAAEMKKEQVAD